MFTQEVIEQIGYYVYRLIDPRNGQTFYVGKGKGNRVFAHVNDALKNYDGVSYIDADEDDVSNKIQTIRDINNSGLKVIHVIQRWGLSENEAFEVESALIDAYAGLTNLQSGFANDRGVTNAEVLQKELSYEVFDDSTDDKFVMIKINSYWMNERGSIYETVRKHWKINLKRIQKIPYVLAVHNGVIVEVFEQEKWYEAVDECPGRCMFDGHVAADNVRNKFINKRLPKKYMKKGMASPVLYHD